MGGLLPQRRPAEAADSSRGGSRRGRWRRPACPSWLFEESITPSAISPRRSRCCCRTARRRATRRCTSGSKSDLLPLATHGGGRAASAMCSRLAELGRHRAFHLEQAHHGRLSRRRVAAARRARAVAQASGVDEGVDRASADGRLAPTASRSARSSRRRAATPTSRARIRSISPMRSRASSKRSATRASGRPSGSGTASARSSSGAKGDVHLVARRRARDRSFPGARRRRGDLLPDGTVHRRRDHAVEGRAAAAVRAASAPHRPQELGAKILAEVPVVLIAYDLLEIDGRDVRERAAGRAARASWRSARRRARESAAFVLSPIVALDVVGAMRAQRTASARERRAKG